MVTSALDAAIILEAITGAAMTITGTFVMPSEILECGPCMVSVSPCEHEEPSNRHLFNLPIIFPFKFSTFHVSLSCTSGFHVISFVAVIPVYSQSQIM